MSDARFGGLGRLGLLGRLGDITPLQACELRSLSKLAYLFYVNVANGDTQKALAALGVFRYLYNDSRATLGTTLNSSAPVSVPDVSWSAPMQIAVGLSLAAALGSSDPNLMRVLSSQPGSMAAIATWFPQFRSALSTGDMTTISEYANTPTSGDYGTAIAGVVRDDLTACRAAAATASPPPVQTPAAPPNYQAAPAQPEYARPYTGPGSSGGGSSGGGGGSSGGGGGSSGGGGGGGGSSGGSSSSMLWTVGIVALVGYGGYLAWKDSKKTATAPLKGYEANPDLMLRARSAARADEKHFECIPTSAMRQSVSMDELTGPKGQSLARKLAKLPAAQAHPVEDEYFRELTASAGTKPKCVAEA